MRTNTKRIFCALAAALMVSAVGATSVFAADAKSDVHVTYSHSNTKPGDPDNPDGVTWAISIPLDVHLSKDVMTAKMPVSIEGYNGVATADINGTVTVKVASTNSWTLLNAAAPNTKLPYTLKYQATGTQGAQETVTGEALGTSGFALTGALPSVTGTLTLTEITGTIPKADYSDTLTYSYAKLPVDPNPTKPGN